MRNAQRPGPGWWQAHRPTRRRLIQLYSALLHNAFLRGFITGDIYRGSAKVLCAPGLNCYSCPAATGACPLGALQNALASADHRAGWYVLGILLLYGVILGRTICGWLCPMGLIQELLNKIPTPKLRKSAVTRALSWLKYLLLAVFVVAIPLGYALRRGIPLPAFCKYVCPAGTLEGAVGLLANPVNADKFGMLGLLFTRKFVILLGTGLACVFCYRAFCRFLCPLGAIYGLFNRFSVVGVRVDGDRCNRCGACVRGCGMDVRRVGDHECIQCGRCMASCEQGAISVMAGRITLAAPATYPAFNGGDAPGRRQKTSRIVRAAALAALGLALLWFNVLDPALGKGVGPAPEPTDEAVVEAGTPEAERFDSDAPTGCEVGQRLEDFTLRCFDGSEFHLADARGRITFINFWATYCAPCVQELPSFDALYRAHEGDIAMVAVHAGLVTQDPEAYLAGKGFVIPFAHDSDDALMALVGGSSTLPRTVVLNRRGEVVYNQEGSVTPELLDALYDLADRPS